MSTYDKDSRYLNVHQSINYCHAFIFFVTTYCCWQGFESRGTEISAKLVTWANLLDSISHVGPLTTNPIQPVTAANRKRDRKTKRQRKKKTRGRHGEDDDDGDVIVSSVNTTESGLERWRREAGPLLGPDHRIAWLCGDPGECRAKIILFYFFY